MKLDTSQPWEMTPEQQRRLRADITPRFHEWQIERAAQVVSIQRIQRAQVDALITLIQSSEGERIFQQERERNKRKPVYTSSGMITRAAGAYAPSHGGRVSLPGVHPRPTLAGRRACGCWLCVR